MTQRLVAWIGAQSLKRVFTSIAEETGVHERSIRRIFRDYIQELETTTAFETPRWLGIDEIHILKRARCFITNVEQRTIIDMLHDRSKVAVSQRLFTLRERKDVRLVTMGMWTPYRDAARAILPQAKIYFNIEWCGLILSLAVLLIFGAASDSILRSSARRPGA